MTRHVVVVGGGVIGLSVALQLAQRGLGVTVVDAGPRDGSGCSYGNAGMIVPSHFVPLAAPGMISLGLRMMSDPTSPFALRPRADRALLGWCLRFWRSATRAHVARSAPVLLALSLQSRALLAEWHARFPDGIGLEELIEAIRQSAARDFNPVTAEHV